MYKSVQPVLNPFNKGSITVISVNSFPLIIRNGVIFNFAIINILFGDIFLKTDIPFMWWYYLLRDSCLIS